jgi:glycosyltransferase involved in cell wall biosynthesis
MTDMMKELLVRSSSPEKIAVIYNTPMYQDVAICSISTARQQLGLDPDAFFFCFIGNIQSKIRSLEVLIDATAIASLTHTFKILFIGDGAGVPLLKREIREKGLDAIFLFSGPIDRFKTIEYANAANVSIVLLPDSKLGDYMVPGKLFVSMGLGKAILATKSAQLQKILGNRAIYVEPAPSASDLALAMIEAIERYGIDQQNLEFVREFKEKYNWDIEKRKFIEILHTIPW